MKKLGILVLVLILVGCGYVWYYLSQGSTCEGGFGCLIIYGFIILIGIMCVLGLLSVMMGPTFANKESVRGTENPFSKLAIIIGKTAIFLVILLAIIALVLGIYNKNHMEKKHAEELTHLQGTFINSQNQIVKLELIKDINVEKSLVKLTISGPKDSAKACEFSGIGEAFSNTIGIKFDSSDPEYHDNTNAEIIAELSEDKNNIRIYTNTYITDLSTKGRVNEDLLKFCKNGGSIGGEYIRQ
jgi:hypothetical protein